VGLHHAPGQSAWRRTAPSANPGIGHFRDCRRQRRRAAALARDFSQARHHPGRPLTEDDIRALIAALGNLRDVIHNAGPAEKAAIYDQLDLKVTFKPGQAKIRAEITIGPDKYVEHAEQCGDTGRVRGGTDPVSPHCSMCYSAEVDLRQTDGPYAL